MNRSDLLSKEEVFDVAGVNLRARNGLIRVMKTLKKAGIYYWLKDNGEIGTTWHHVHSANAQSFDETNEEKLPNFKAVS